MNPTAWCVNDLLELLLECGRVGLRHFAQNEWWLKSDRTLVTAADGEIEALIARHLDFPEKGSWMLGEETSADRGEENVRAVLQRRAWVVDPIDGTAPFAHKLAYWGTSIGLMEKGVLTEGAVILPREGELFISDGPNVYFAENVDVEAGVGSVDLCLLAPRPLPMSEGGMIALSQVIAKTAHFRRPNPVHVSGCAISSLLYVMLGRYLAYFGHLKLWDLAGALPLLLKSGFEATHFDGQLLTAEVTGAHYVLDAAAPNRWAVRGGACFAPAGIGAQLRSCLETE